MADEHDDATITQRHHALARELAALGFCLPGSVAVRQIRCPNRGCHCHHDPPQLHGPYTAWTRKGYGQDKAEKSISCHGRSATRGQMEITPSRHLPVQLLVVGWDGYFPISTVERR